ncbi:MAG: hypothetical protein KJ626_11600 [Verrucomicrobia bacterium]|nr:hypothetical protein [Verrucomicrobiota bacterium]
MKGDIVDIHFTRPQTVYRREGSDAWQELALASEAPLSSSGLLEVELAYSFHQKEQRRELKKNGANAFIRLFKQDDKAGRSECR